MNPADLLAPPDPTGLPAPYPLLAALKVLGFTLHMVPMNLWLAGILLAMMWRRFGGAEAQRASGRLMRQMPILVALGVNLGIVPLLFMQVAYGRVFYPATILMAWFWFLVIALLVPAYYGVYIYVGGLKSGAELGALRRAVGWTSAVLFVVVGFLFANAFSLMVNLPAWPRLWAGTNAAAAVTGLALNVGDASLLPRWLMMGGLALMTSAVWLIVDATFLDADRNDAYGAWSRRAAARLYVGGLAFYGVTATWYVFGTWPDGQDGLLTLMTTGWRAVLTGLTVAAPVVTAALLVWFRRRPSRALAIVVVCGQLVVLGLNAGSRQVVQNLELAPYIDVTAQTVRPQWSPLAAFVATLAGGLVVVAWMLRQVVTAWRRPAQAPSMQE